MSVLKSMLGLGHDGVNPFAQFLAVCSRGEGVGAQMVYRDLMPVESNGML
jgi:hypothetical protein